MFAKMVFPGLENLEVSISYGCSSGHYPAKGSCSAGIVPANGYCRAGALR